VDDAAVARVLARDADARVQHHGRQETRLALGEPELGDGSAAPMHEPPTRIDNDAAPAEIPVGLASSMLGGVWRAEDTPMLLHMFEYIARGAVLRWWNSLTSNGQTTSPPHA